MRRPAVLWTLASGDPAQEIEEAERKLAEERKKIARDGPKRKGVGTFRLQDPTSGRDQGAREIPVMVRLSRFGRVAAPGGLLNGGRLVGHGVHPKNPS